MGEEFAQKDTVRSIVVGTLPAPPTNNKASSFSFKSFSAGKASKKLTIFLNFAFVNLYFS